MGLAPRPAQGTTPLASHSSFLPLLPLPSALRPPPSALRPPPSAPSRLLLEKLNPLLAGAVSVRGRPALAASLAPAGGLWPAAAVGIRLEATELALQGSPLLGQALSVLSVADTCAALRCALRALFCRAALRCGPAAMLLCGCRAGGWERGGAAAAPRSLLPASHACAAPLLLRSLPLAVQVCGP